MLNVEKRFKNLSEINVEQMHVFICLCDWVLFGGDKDMMYRNTCILIH